MHRLESTARDNGNRVHRIRDILSQPFHGRHVMNFRRAADMIAGQPIIEASRFWNIKQSGLIISKGGTAIYGDGAYCFSIRTPPTRDSDYYIDLEIPPGIGCEQISIPDITAYYYRFLPAVGDTIPVRILGSNIPTNVLMDAADRR